MSPSESPCLNLSITRLVASEVDHFAIWVLKAPYPGGYVHHDCILPESLTQTWLAWQQMFSLTQSGGGVPPVISTFSNQTTSYSGRLMQQLGIQLWQWLFDGAIKSSLDHSQGIAAGLDQPLRLRLDIRAPDLIALPWEIMQSQAGTQAISLSQKLLFSRTTSDVDPLPLQRNDAALNILLVLGQDSSNSRPSKAELKLEQEAAALSQILKGAENKGDAPVSATVPCLVDTLIQPTPAELISRLEMGSYNILFYGGHGEPAPDGGLLFLRPGVTVNGTELAQVLTRCRVTLAVFNACWGAQPAQHNNVSIPRSSLAEVLIHHGVPAVLAMRDVIADREALSFIQAFARALSERMSIDRAVAVARQQLLTLYKFNQPAWTLPVLYLHPEFDGQLLQPLDGITELPNTPTWMGQPRPTAFLRRLGATPKICRIYGGLMRVGRNPDNDLVICEPWVSQQHGKIFCRDERSEDNTVPTYFLKDESRFGTLILGGTSWQKVHHQEMPLQSGMQIRFGSSQGETWEFIIDS